MKKGSSSTDGFSSPSEVIGTYDHGKADSPKRISLMENKYKSPNK